MFHGRKSAGLFPPRGLHCQPGNIPCTTPGRHCSRGWGGWVCTEAGHWPHLCQETEHWSCCVELQACRVQDMAGLATFSSQLPPELHRSHQHLGLTEEVEVRQELDVVLHRHRDRVRPRGEVTVSVLDTGHLTGQQLKSVSTFCGAYIDRIIYHCLENPASKSINYGEIQIFCVTCVTFCI